MSNKKTIALWGSCLVKDPFTTYFNKDYKKFYDVKILDQKHSFISLFQEKNIIDETLLDIYPKNPANNFQSRCLKEDFNKSFLDKMKSESIDYLIMDIFFEIGHGILCYDNKIITNDENLEKTEFYKQLTNFKELSLLRNFDEYFKLWTEYCDKFFRFLNIYCPNTKVILAQSWAETKVINFEGEIYEDDIFIQRSNTHNPLYKILEDYILEHYDVYFLDSDTKNLLCNENHVWGKFYVHYTDEYYTRFLKKVGEIIQYDELRKKYETKHIIKHSHFIKDIIDLGSALDSKSSINHVHKEFSKSQLKSIQKILNGEGMFKKVTFDVLNLDVDFNHKIRIFNINVQDFDDNFIKLNFDKLGIYIDYNRVPNKFIKKIILDGQDCIELSTDFLNSGIHKLSIKYDETFSKDYIIYLKDKRNLFDFDVWLGSDFTCDVSNFDMFQVDSISSSNEWSDIGERSVKVECNGEYGYQALVTKGHDVTAGEVMSAYVTIFNPENEVIVRLYESSAASFSDIVVRASDVPTRVNVTKKALTNRMQLLLISRDKQTFYADNFVFMKKN